jgi:hypothetical protein
MVNKIAEKRNPASFFILFLFLGGLPIQARLA